jgi:hypothetical protein
MNAEVVLADKELRKIGMKVIRDTRLRTGNQAKVSAVSLIVLSSILIIFAFFFLYWPYAFEKTVLKKKSSNGKMIMIIKKGGEIE